LAGQNSQLRPYFWGNRGWSHLFRIRCI